MDIVSPTWPMAASFTRIFHRDAPPFSTGLNLSSTQKANEDGTYMKNNSQHCPVKTTARQCYANKSCRQRLPGCLRSPGIEDGTSHGQPMFEK